MRPMVPADLLSYIILGCIVSMLDKIDASNRVFPCVSIDSILMELNPMNWTQITLPFDLF